MATIEELEQRLAALDAGGGFADYNRTRRLRELQGMRGMGQIGQSMGLGWNRPGLGTSGMAERMALEEAIASEQRRLAAADRSRARERRELEQQLEALRNRESALGLTEGRAQDILDDPRYTAAMDVLQQQAEQGSLPDDVLGLMQGRFGDLVGAQQDAAQSALRDSFAAAGLTPSDPAAQARMRQVTEAGQLERAGNWRDLLIQQAVENAQTQRTAAGMLGGMRGQQYALGNPLAQQAAGMYAQTYDEPRTAVTQQYQVPQYQMPQHTPLPMPQVPQPSAPAQPAPQTQPAPRQQTRTPGQRPNMYVGGAGAPGSGPTGQPPAPSAPSPYTPAPGIAAQPLGPVQALPVPDAADDAALMQLLTGQVPQEPAPNFNADMAYYRNLL